MNLSYKLVRSHRRSLCLLIKEGELVVRAPYLTPKFFIDRFVASKTFWIKKHLQKPSPSFKRQYNEGEKFLLFGKEYKLRVIKTNQKDSNIYIRGLQLNALVYDTSKKFLKLAIEKFYRLKTQKIVLGLIKKYEPGFKGKVTIKPYKSKWGSCSGRDDLTFNLKLAMTPIEVIKYVLLHELSHIREKNHSKRFWKLVEASDNQYNEKRKWLRENHQRIVL